MPADASLFSPSGRKPFRSFSASKRELDELSDVERRRLELRRTCVSGMATQPRPHVADDVLNHQSGTIAGVAAVYQRQDSRSRKDALVRWGTHVADQLMRAERLVA